jgi:hypothetical protein
MIMLDFDTWQILLLLGLACIAFSPLISIRGKNNNTSTSTSPEPAAIRQRNASPGIAGKLNGAGEIQHDDDALQILSESEEAQLPGVSENARAEDDPSGEAVSDQETNPNQPSHKSLALDSRVVCKAAVLQTAPKVPGSTGCSDELTTALDELMPAEATSGEAPQTLCKADAGIAPVWLQQASERCLLQRRAMASSAPSPLQKSLLSLPPQQALLWAAVIQADSTAQLLAKAQPPHSRGYASAQGASSRTGRDALNASLGGQRGATAAATPKHSLLQPLLRGLAPAPAQAGSPQRESPAGMADTVVGSALLCALQRSGVVSDTGAPLLPSGTPALEAGRVLGQSLPGSFVAAMRNEALLPLVRTVAGSNLDVQKMILARDERTEAAAQLLQHPGGGAAVTLLVPLQLGSSPVLGSKPAVKAGANQRTFDDDLLDDAFDF